MAARLKEVKRKHKLISDDVDAHRLALEMLDKRIADQNEALAAAAAIKGLVMVRGKYELPTPVRSKKDYEKTGRVGPPPVKFGLGNLRSDHLTGDDAPEEAALKRRQQRRRERELEREVHLKVVHEELLAERRAIRKSLEEQGVSMKDDPEHAGRLLVFGGTEALKESEGRAMAEVSRLDREVEDMTAEVAALTRKAMEDASRCKKDLYMREKKNFLMSQQLEEERHRSRTLKVTRSEHELRALTLAIKIKVLEEHLALTR
jgi:hypothetical protein